jgi:hypothetical protein
MAGDEKNVGGVAIDDGQDPLGPLTAAIKEGDKALLRWLAMVGSEIIRLDAAATPTIQSQHIRFRLRGVIVNPVTAGTLTLQIGTATYPFDGAARSLQFIPFPLLIERGSDMSCAGADGRIYLIGDPE